MSDVITIAEFKKLDPDKTYTSCLSIKVTKVTVPTEGETKGRKWKRQAITISDKTGELNLSLFNGTIGKFIQGKSYLICELAVDSWNGNTTAKIVPNTTIKEIVQTSDNFLKDKQQINSEQESTQKQIEQTKSKLFNQIKLELIDDELDKLMVIESMVREKLPKEGCSSYDAKVGMYMKFINDMLNLEK